MNFIYLFFIFSWLKIEKDSVHNKISIAKIKCDIVQVNLYSSSQLFTIKSFNGKVHLLWKQKYQQKIKQRYYWNFSNPFIANVPTGCHTLNTPTAHTETNRKIVYNKLIDWFLHKYKKLEIQWIHQ